MTNFRDKKRAVAVIEEVLELTDEEYLQRLIDKPVEKVFASFEFDRNARVSHYYFMDVVGDFVRRIYLDGLGVSQNLSRSQARAEALIIIERAYQSQDVQGYYAALAEAFNGIESVLARIAEFIITRTRERHIRWVHSSRIDPFDWPTRCLIAEILIERWGPFLPPGIRSCNSAQLADALPQLFNAVTSTVSIVRKTTGAGIEFYQFPEMHKPFPPLFGSEEPKSTVFT